MINNGITLGVGVVEICYRKAWGTPCDEGWNVNAMSTAWLLAWTQWLDDYVIVMPPPRGLLGIYMCIYPISA